MRTIAFVGPSGTGKSYRATMVSNQNGADAIIDDGILISHGRLIAGTSAKKEPTRIASVKHALFMDNAHAEAVKRGIRESNIKCLMILGTSDGMVQKIAKRLGVEPIEKIIRIEDVATPEEMAMAKDMRLNQGKHVIPVPTFEIKHDFSGYFLHPLRLFRKNLDKDGDLGEADKSIVRPTFSYMGDFTISDNALISIVRHEAERADGVRVIGVSIRKTPHGLHIDVTASLTYGADISKTCRSMQERIKNSIEMYTSLNARRVHILVKNLKLK
ncbi:MAG: Asp23/Gls24 family envelope stress response protein [Clostridia bacterium]|nr:Asp23/Gls24 family envelope stress response protein [Clostridia bacterium]